MAPLRHRCTNSIPSLTGLPDETIRTLVVHQVHRGNRMLPLRHIAEDLEKRTARRPVCKTLAGGGLAAGFVCIALLRVQFSDSEWRPTDAPLLSIGALVGAFVFGCVLMLFAVTIEAEKSLDQGRPDGNKNTPDPLPVPNLKSTLQGSRSAPRETSPAKAESRENAEKTQRENGRRYSRKPQRHERTPTKRQERRPSR
jgi:hypothetical protein